MKTAICYYSRHHGNTLKVLEAMAEVAGADLVDVTSRMAARLPQYDRIGFASGIYYSKFHDTVVHYAASTCPRAKKPFSSVPTAPPPAPKSIMPPSPKQ